MHKYKPGDTLRAVRGPGGSMEAEPEFIGRECTVLSAELMRGSGRYYKVGFRRRFGDSFYDYVDEVCLERA